MADDTTTSSYEGQGQGGRSGGGRGAGNREPGGFRIRLSDNEMRAARAIQEVFRLRSTVAALGFSIRTVAQLLEEGKLDELVAQQQAQAGNRGDGPRGGRRGEGRGEGRGERREERGPRIDPFARPAKPAPAATEAAPTEDAAEEAAEAVEHAAPDAVSEAPAEDTTSTDATEA
jgi:hypothetical protein